MNERTTEICWLTISNLPPAAARLLLALFTVQPHEPENIAMERSGIYSTLTYLASYKLLVERGFVYWKNGQRYITLYVETPAKLTEERHSYGAATMITKAKIPQ